MISAIQFVGKKRKKSFSPYKRQKRFFGEHFFFSIVLSVVAKMVLWAITTSFLFSFGMAESGTICCFPGIVFSSPSLLMGWSIGVPKRAQIAALLCASSPFPTTFFLTSTRMQNMIEENRLNAKKALFLTTFRHYILNYLSKWVYVPDYFVFFLHHVSESESKREREQMVNEPRYVTPH